MKTSLGVALLLATSATAHQEPAPRRLAMLPVQANAQFMTVSGVRELKSGQLLVTDAKKPAIYLLDPKTGSASVLGSAGADSSQYVQPGGIYSGRADTVFVLDRGQARISILSPSGTIVGVRSIKQVGVQTASDADVDYQRVDSRGLAYFTVRGGRLLSRLSGGGKTDSISLVRFDPLRQHGDTIARLRTREAKIVSMDEHMQITQSVIGSPEDTWGIAADGRVAVVRAEPYRVEWYGGKGVEAKGPVVAHDVILYTAAEKEAISSASQASAAGAGTVGSERKSASGAPRVFAPNKPPFEPNGEAIVSPDGRVWVPRNLPAGASKTIYDVFDGKGDRIDRVELPERSRVVGFGTGSVYAMQRDERGAASLRKYKL